MALQTPTEPAWVGLISQQDKLDVIDTWKAMQKQQNVTSPQWIGQGAAALNSLDSLIRRG